MDSKINTKINIKILLFTLFLLSLSFPLFADDCGSPLNCPAGKKYPYAPCTDSPTDNPSILGRKHILPVRVCESTWRFVPQKTTPVGEINLANFKEYSGYQLLDTAEMWKELQEACNAWNCVCGYDNENDTTGDCIYVKYDPQNNGEKTAGWVGYNGVNINFSPNFLYGIENKELDYDDFDSTRKIKKLYYNQKYASNLIPIWDSLEAIGNPDNVYIYSFRAVAMHEIGHVLGFSHYEICDTCYDADDEKPTGLMRAHGIVKYPVGLSADDKCMFAKLYCPDLVGIEEETTIRPNIIITPNPTNNKELTISFEITDNIKPVTISICNENGQILETLFSDVMYSEGTHTYNAKLNQPSGVYFIITNINKTIYFDKIIVK